MLLILITLVALFIIILAYYAGYKGFALPLAFLSVCAIVYTPVEKWLFYINLFNL